MKHYENVSFTIRLSLRSQQLLYAEFLKISVVLFGDFNTVSENEPVPVAARSKA
jgi:hypothetical protein